MRFRTKLAAAVASIVFTAGALVGCAAGADSTATTTSGVAEVSASSVLAENQTATSTEDDAVYEESDVVDISLDRRLGDQQRRRRER